MSDTNNPHGAGASLPIHDFFRCHAGIRAQVIGATRDTWPLMLEVPVCIHFDVILESGLSETVMGDARIDLLSQQNAEGDGSTAPA